MEVERPRVAAVGHVEWVRFARVPHVPRPGEVTHARDPFEEPAGGGAVAAVQLARLAGVASLFTSLGDDEEGRRALARLSELGVRVHAVRCNAPTRAAVTLIDDSGERTITTFGKRLEPSGEDGGMPWDALDGFDAVYFTAGDLAALRAARRARALVASPRAIHAVGRGVRLDALVLSEEDRVERREAGPAREEADLVALTEGARGGVYEHSSESRRWTAAPLPGPPVDSYGCGDSFAAGLTYGLGVGLRAAAALELAARCGAVCATGRGPYERQLTRLDLEGPPDR
jgi:ribokinase